MRLPSFLGRSETPARSDAPRSGVRPSVRSGDQTLMQSLRHLAQSNVVRAVAAFGGGAAVSAGASGCEPEVVYVDCDTDDECEDRHHHREDKCEENHHDGKTECDSEEGEGEGEGEGYSDSKGEGEGRPVPNPTACTSDPSLPDRDRDGVSDFLDTCPNSPGIPHCDKDGEVDGEINGDGDRYGDSCDPCPANPNPDCGMEGSGNPPSEGEGEQHTEICGDGVDNDYDGQIDENDCVRQG